MTGDIYISETEKIVWIEFDHAEEDFDVDYIFSKHENFWHALEVFCMAGCCGLDAFFRYYFG